MKHRLCEFRTARAQNKARALPIDAVAETSIGLLHHSTTYFVAAGDVAHPHLPVAHPRHHHTPRRDLQPAPDPARRCVRQPQSRITSPA